MDREDIIAFGDMPNDIEMLSWVGHGVARDNAHPYVKEAADAVTVANHQQQPRLKQTMTASMTGQHQDNTAPDTQQCTNIQPLCNNPTV